MKRALTERLFVLPMIAAMVFLAMPCCAPKRTAAPVPLEQEQPEQIELEPQEFMDLLVAALDAKAKIEARTEIPLEVNDLVIIELAFFLGPARKQIELGFQRLPEFRQKAAPILADEGVPQELIYVAFVESRFDPNAVSPSGAVGAWQIMKETAKHLGLKVGRRDQRRDIEASTRAAARYLASLYDMFGDWYFALAAYNAGPGTIRRLISRYALDNYWELCAADIRVKVETKRYVPKFIAATLIFEAPEKFGIAR